ncbi:MULTISPECIES: hypothetical protein [Prochlorococcus]|uniref:Uncharacterized protein n=1 Tax=Prochlorococcus marinus (strain SARG / CCMP1375 / SS120) TaxID=167539 RepID=Q7VCS4_PROMA|nr:MULTISPECIES: hypothetical protein [Prochlorococcus]AAP99710.1 Predicted protein [Prochlorococcus marinus subsp. marinus str. CCMP1375]KGG13390.1 putative DUP family [Prochlorococcus marinus str. LG]KGG21366.1 putative DUP family [Prochlorococcus marinus str. SS2]KGG24302.1 putative DUP family [Prochlorococcus marinus str. SS35]KGG33586.1 putative DUP family [Prochlorococcus marinus str. SS51]
MASIKKVSEPFEDFTDEQIADLEKSIGTLEEESERIIKEEMEEAKRKKAPKSPFKRLRKSPLEIVNRSLFFLFLGSFLFSFSSVYTASRWWFFWYVISAFSCILYTPNRKALKELLDAWPNIEDLIKGRSQ